MAKLVLSLDGAVIGSHFLEKERLTIGRKQECDIRIDDQGVSKEHAAIVTVGNDQILEDAHSTNGTLVNGKKVARHILQNGDVIEIGSYRLKYINQKASPDMDFDRTMLISELGREEPDTPQAEETEPIPSIQTARSSKSSFPLAMLKGMSGETAGRKIELDRALTLVGQRGVQTAVISRRPHGYFITHVAGKKYPLVNGRSIGAEARALADGDVAQVGKEKVQFFLA